ncbi:uncharacterized protein [Scyliorhinus torazame]|uniref:uncharacterized protein isoform X1 n=1 Tax=Scyliorhinus torazame TaxID=75743 RepID=UPI003B5CE662
MNANQDEISLVCLVKGFQPKSITQTWSSNNRVITTGIKKFPAVQGKDMNYTMSSVLQVPASDWNANSVYHCKAGYKSDEMVEAKIRKPKAQAPNVILLVPSMEAVYNQTTVVLGCMISGFAPDSIQVSWKKGQMNQMGVVLPSQQSSDDTFATVSYLTVPVADWKEGNDYSCGVTHKPSGFDNRIRMRYREEMSVFIQNPSMEEVWMKKAAILICTVVCSDPSQVQITWNVNRKERIIGVTTQQQREKGIVISKLQTTAEEWDSGVEFVCSAQGSSSSSPVPKQAKSAKAPVQPKRPNVRLLPPPAQEVKNQSTVMLECVITGFYPGLIDVYWEKDGSQISSSPGFTALEQAGTFSVRHYLTVNTEVWRKGSVFTCAVSHPATNFSTKKKVNNILEMSVFMQNPSIEEVWINKTATLLCTVVCSDPSQVHISWNVNGKERSKGVTTQQQREEGTQYTVISQLRTTVEEWDSGAEFVCSAQSGSSSSPISKRTKSSKVHPKSPKVRLLPPPAQEVENQSTATLECIISGFYPNLIHISWEKDGTPISSNTRAGLTALEQGKAFSVRHYLTVNTEEWRKGSVFTCAVSHPASNFNINETVNSIQGMSVFLRDPSVEEVWMNRTATLECSVVCSDPSSVQLSWEVSSKKRSEGVSTQSPTEEGSLHIIISQLQTSAEEWESGVEFVCSAQGASSSVPVSKRISSAKVVPKGPRVRLLPPTKEEMKMKNTATLECVITGFYPDLINVTWEKDGALISSKTRAGLTALEQAGTFSVRHYLTVSAAEWKKGSTFICAVSHPASHFGTNGTVRNVQGECVDTGISVTLRKPPFEEIWRNRTATILCEILHSDLEGVRVTWLVDGIEREDGVKTQGPKRDGDKDMIFSRLTVPAAEWESGVEYLCLVEDKSLPTPEKRSIRKAQVDVKTHPQVYLLPPSLDEMETDQTATLVCLVTGFSPAEIYLAWMANDTLLKSGFVNQPVTEDGSSGWNSGSQLTVSADEWNRGTTYSCVVGHESATTNLFRSINKSHSKPTLVNVSLVLTDSFKSCS